MIWKRLARGLRWQAGGYLVLLSTAAYGQTGGLAVGDVTLITGRPDMSSALAQVVNFEAGDLVAGRTAWILDGILFTETRVGFLWSPVGGAQVFEVSSDIYFDRNVQNSADIASNGIVVGTDTFTAIGNVRTKPFFFASSVGFNFLPLPRNPEPGGGPPVEPSGEAFAISEDGSVGVGQIQFGGPFFDEPTHAVAWYFHSTGPRLRVMDVLLNTADLWSSAMDASDDGSVLVGHSGPDRASVQAARWNGGIFEALMPVGSSSSGRFVSADGSTTVGTAVVAGQTVVVQWDVNGEASVATPPVGWSVRDLNAANASGTAAVGVLVTPDPTKPLMENWAPFVWSAQDGIVMIPELGREQDYDLSEALDVTDDGNMVVGRYRATIVAEGDPPELGFIWIRGTGVVLLNDLMAAAGFADPDYYRVDAISGDGTRIMATGNPPGRTIHDTNSAIVQLLAQ